MKKYLVLALASLFAFASCSKESIGTPGTEETKEEVSVLSFTSKRPQLKSESKTAWDGTTIVWSTGDKIRVGYTLDGAWMGKEAAAPTAAKFYASNDVTIDNNNQNIGTFDVPVGSNGFTDPGTSGAYVFYGVYPYKAIESTVTAAPSLTVTLPVSQTPAANSFDATGDIMVGKTAVLGSFPSDPVEITWNRIVAHLDLTFKNLAAVSGYTEGETVSSIKLTTNSGAPIAGTFSLNLTDNSVSNASSNEIVLNGDHLSISSGNIEAWCCVLPVTISSLNVEITTNKAKYTRSITGISKTFKQNARNLLAVNMQNAEREDHSNKYILVKDTDELTDGSEVIIVATNYNYAMSTTQNSNNRSRQSVTKTTADGVTYIENPADAVQIFTLKAGSEENTVAFQCKNGGQAGSYIYAAASNNNYLRSQTSNNANGSFTVEFENGVATLKAQGTNTRNWIRYNTNGQFSCYASGQQDVSLYKLVGSGSDKNLLPVVPHIVVTSDNPISVDNTSGSQTITYTLSHVVGGSVTATTDVPSWITNINCTSEHVTFDFAANDPDGAPRKGHITLSYTGAEDVVVTVDQAGGDNVGYKYTYTSNVASLSGTSSFGVVIDGDQYDAYCGGSRSSAGSISFVVPAGTTKVYFHAVRYGSDTAPTVTITASVGTVGTVTPSLSNMRACSTIGGGNTAPYTVTTDPDTDFFELTVSGITAESTITLTNNRGQRRFVVWGVNAVAE